MTKRKRNKYDLKIVGKPFLCRSLFGNVENQKRIAAIFAFAFAPHSYKTQLPLLRLQQEEFKNSFIHLKKRSIAVQLLNEASQRCYMNAILLVNKKDKTNQKESRIFFKNYHVRNNFLAKKSARASLQRKALIKNGQPVIILYNLFFAEKNDSFDNQLLNYTILI